MDESRRKYSFQFDYFKFNLYKTTKNGFSAMPSLIELNKNVHRNNNHQSGETSNDTVDNDQPVKRRRSSVARQFERVKNTIDKSRQSWGHRRSLSYDEKCTRSALRMMNELRQTHAIAQDTIECLDRQEIQIMNANEGMITIEGCVNDLRDDIDQLNNSLLHSLRRYGRRHQRRIKTQEGFTERQRDKAELLHKQKQHQAMLRDHSQISASMLTGDEPGSTLSSKTNTTVERPVLLLKGQRTAATNRAFNKLAVDSDLFETNTAGTGGSLTE